LTSPKGIDHVSVGNGGIDLVGQAEHEGQGLDVTVPDAAGVGAQDAPDECAVLVLDGRRRRFGVNLALTVSGLVAGVPGDGLAGVVMVPGIGLAELASLFGQFERRAFPLVEALGVGPVNVGAGDACDERPWQQ
jgi:hypothetical protein